MKYYIPIKKYNLALCLSGRLDNIKYCYNNWKKNILKYYNIDIFMHCSLPSDKNKEYIEKYIKPKRIVYYDLGENTKLKDLLKLQIYRIYKCNLMKNEYMKKYNIKYDYIIKSRPDIVYNQILNLDFINDTSKLFIPVNHKFYNSPNIYNLGITDQLFIGTNYIMDIACNFHIFLKKYNYISCMIPEIKFKKYLKDNYINFIYFKYDWDIYYYKKLIYRGFLSKKYLKKIPQILNKTCFINL